MDIVLSYNVRSNNSLITDRVYNLFTMQTSLAPQTIKVERDTRIFVWFMTLIIVVMYIISLVNEPAVRQAKILIPLTALLVVHIILHWQLERITRYQPRILWYIVIQGVLAFVISILSNSIGMTFALFMALLGEAVGLLRLTRAGWLAGIYYLTLMVLGLVQRSGWASSGFLLLGTIPMVIFVVIYVTLYMRQNEARERAELLAAELERANRQLSEFAAQVEDLTIANERQRIARELHDTLSQGLAGLILQLEAADAHLAKNRTDKARSIVANAMDRARLTLANARRAIDDLRQSTQDDLDSALHVELSRFTNATGVPVHFHAGPIPPLLDPIQEVVLRAVAEALTNIAQHAQAQNVEVNIQVEHQHLQVTIQDDGQGFDPSVVPSGHYGILGIKERVRLVNGSLEIQSKQYRGTTLKIEIPLGELHAQRVKDVEAREET